MPQLLQGCMRISILIDAILLQKFFFDSYIVCERLETFGCSCFGDNAGDAPKINVYMNIINVLAYVEFNPHLSTRTIAHDLGVNRTTVQNILKEYRFHPYHLVLHQELSAQDFDRRLDHCHWLLGMIAEDPQVLSNILWTDEATFHSNGGVNLHNIHYWSPTNPHWMRGPASRPLVFKLLGRNIRRSNYRPIFFNNALNGANYLQFLREELPILLEDVPLEIRQRMMFQHDGCPAHFARSVREFLDATTLVDG
ncbi:uncharacterized protein LOC126739181 [Anthonomus grandis grandis]|uniref:uncharacterized protein LOC126739181 n=1 Tax=Anthonomus grandis grandis TaxID=2921223 RepID=UPI002165AAAC|nr:uncharacterized protein LOC126739181 [Anthonomus grandis grandis]